MGIQLVTNSPDGTTGLGPKGNQVAGKAGSEPLLHFGLVPTGPQRMLRYEPGTLRPCPPRDWGQKPWERQEALGGSAGLSCCLCSDFLRNREGGGRGERRTELVHGSRGSRRKPAGTIMSQTPVPGLSRLLLSEKNKSLFPLPFPSPQPQATSAPTCAAQIVVCHCCGQPWGSGSDSFLGSV